MLHTLPPKVSWRSALLWGLGATLALRVGLGAIMSISWITARPHLPLDSPAYRAAFGDLPIPSTIPGELLLSVWTRWDAVHHLNLAMKGYLEVPPGDSVFYPLYAVLTRLVATCTGAGYLLSGLVVSSLAAVCAIACLYRLAGSAFGTQAARWSVVALSVYPTAVFLIAPFTESLFLALTMAAFIAAYDGKWLVVGILGLLASLTRGPGLLTTVPLAIIGIQQWSVMEHDRKASHVALVAVALGLTLAGGLGFLAWRSTLGFLPVSESLRTYSGLELVDPITGLVSAVAQWARVPEFNNTFDLASALTFLGACALLAAHPRWRRWDWLAYMVVNMLFLLGKRSFEASSLQSMSRYVLALFPAFIVVGDWLAGQGSRVRFAYVAVSCAALVTMSALYSLWVFIG
jgi:hypothetical protein